MPCVATCKAERYAQLRTPGRTLLRQSTGTPAPRNRVTSSKLPAKAAQYILLAMTSPLGVAAAMGSAVLAAPFLDRRLGSASARSPSPHALGGFGLGTQRKRWEDSQATH